MLAAGTWQLVPGNWQLLYSLEVSRFPDLGPNVPRRGSALSRTFWRGVAGAIGWRVDGVVPDVAKLVIVVAPHTSNLDFFIGMILKLAIGIDIRWLGKHTIFRRPVAGILRALGGIPVDRHAPKDTVEQIAEEIGRNDAIFLGLSPEGTRRRVERWKTGFYRIALAARLPILPVALDYRVRAARVGPLFAPTGRMDEDVLALGAFFTAPMARRPELYNEDVKGPS